VSFKLGRDTGSGSPAAGLPEFVTNGRNVRWTVEYRLIRQLGEGGQGVVYLADRFGTDGYKVPVALKFFSQERYADHEEYCQNMARLADIAARVALIQHDNLVDVHNFAEFEGIRTMSMEWVDGFDLAYLLASPTLAAIKNRVSSAHWAHLNDVVITSRDRNSRLKPGVAIAIVRECLGALGALHRGGIVHGDVKPSNIMLKKMGNTKLVDLGSACRSDPEDSEVLPFTPQYAAPEVLEGGNHSPYSDLASLGYVLVEMLAGQAPFDGVNQYSQLVRAKRNFANDLESILPDEVLASETLMHLVTSLVQPEPLRRFPSTEVAELLGFGAANFQRELIAGDLASEYESEIRLWLMAVK
jgi:serine/threonine-protein kinase